MNEEVIEWYYYISKFLLFLGNEDKGGGNDVKI